MYLTVQTLLNDPNIVKAVIDRVIALRLDTIYWKKHLDFEKTRSRVFKTYLGTVTGVTAGSVIDRNSGKPLRERKSLGSGYGEVAYMGDRYQMDNERLDMLNLSISSTVHARQTSNPLSTTLSTTSLTIFVRFFLLPTNVWTSWTVLCVLTERQKLRLTTIRRV